MRFLILLLTTCIAFGCDDECGLAVDACTAEDPIAEVEWLRELKNSLADCTCQQSINQGEYLGETVFYVVITDPLCSSFFAPTLYSCSGTIIKKFGTTEEDQEELRKLSFEQELYRCKD